LLADGSGRAGGVGVGSQGAGDVGVLDVRSVVGELRDGLGDLPASLAGILG
jgi:hypothetical protein